MIMSFDSMIGQNLHFYSFTLSFSILGCSQKKVCQESISRTNKIDRFDVLTMRKYYYYD